MPIPTPEDALQVLIVVGAHLRAEIADRPLAYELADTIRTWQADHAPHLNVVLEPVVLTDLWYLNDEDLQQKPTISLGGPGVNALSNAFAQITGHAQRAAAQGMDDSDELDDLDELKDADELDEQEELSKLDDSGNDTSASAQATPPHPANEPTILIQFDPEYTDLRCCIWGSNHALTVKGLDLFVSDYLDQFLKAVVTQVEPRTD